MTIILVSLLFLIAASAASAHPRVSGLSTTNRAIRDSVRKSDPCLAQIIEHETGGTWEPTIYNGFSHRHPGELMKKLSYGLPQSWPAEKMASAGPDWRTDWRTQLRWMRGYVKARYGSACAALSYWLRHKAY